MSRSRKPDKVVIGSPPPQLPKKFLSNLRKQACMVGAPTGFSKVEFNQARHDLILHYCPIDELLPVNDTDLRLTFLQIVSEQGYVALVCEMIRLGARIDAPDSIGQTALFRVVKEYCKLQDYMDDPLSYVATQHYNSNLIPKLAMRLKWIACLLINQHTDVNVGFDGLTCLRMLCKATIKDWELIGLLVTHGAHDDVDGRIAYKLSKAEKQRLNGLFRGRESGRPPCQCPCLSGRVVSECHENQPTPYPSHFLCPCRSVSAYARCCRRRLVAWREVWNDEEGTIETWRVEKPINIPLPKDTFHVVSKIIGATLPPNEELKRPNELPSVVTQTGIPPELQEKVDWVLHLEDLFRKKLVDRAFAYAMIKTEWHIRPLGRKLPKSYAMFHARSYNECVDDYIANGRDNRKTLDIEIAAKLGPSCGALYRICEADGCSKQEGRNVSKLKMCQKCKMTVYCSIQCQKDHWKDHKPICGAPSQTEQPLPSQRVLHESISAGVVKIVSDLIQRLKAGDPERYLQLFPEGVPADFEKEHTNITLDKY
ncbi:hypothetical protein BD410DRAFT_896884 [Rickenella mellea]|uniref:MYND-type domain-containing protein n=1 Tax=Rickenella mellea TaxID=50990 RepID=A0A4Y7Q928_9AGAM|nr:hypothetical protein BD410DRAFT_896884 [Rickenella mellea]